MKNKLIIVSIFGLMICFSCKEQVSEPIVIEKKVFENLQSCCKVDETCNYPIEIKDITGKLYAAFTDNKGKQMYSIIFPDQRPMISDSILPFFSVYGGGFDVCNMPKELLYSDRERRVKFSCKFFYWYAAVNYLSGGVIYQSSGYPTELTQIEVLD